MDLSFSIAVDSDKSEEELLRLLLLHIPEATRTGGYIKFGCNVMKFEKNFDYDQTKCNDPEDGWQYYRYDFDVFPVEPTDVETQYEAAMLILKIFDADGAKTQMLSEFSD